MNKLRQHIEEITPLNNEEFEYIKTFFTKKKVKKHQYLLQERDKVASEYWIAKGIFRAFYIDVKGNEHIIQFALENWWICDYNAFFNQTKSAIYIVCMEDAEVYSLTLYGREQLASESHKMEHFFRVRLITSYSGQQLRIMSLLSNNPKQRYEEFAKLYPNMIQKIPKKYIAEYLGVSRETLSRL